MSNDKLERKSKQTTVIKAQQGKLIRDAREAKNLPQKTLADQSQKHLLNKLGVEFPITQKNITDLENNNVELDLIRGLAIASVLDMSLADFIDESILTLGSLDVKIVENSKLISQYGRFIIYSSFPSFVYISNNQNYFDYSQEIRQFEDLYNQYLKCIRDTKENYSVLSFFDFLFSPQYKKQEKLNILLRLQNMFSKKDNNSLHFFHKKIPTGNSVDIRIIKAINLLSITLPMSKRFTLEIKSPLICEKILHEFHNDTKDKITSLDDSLIMLNIASEIIKEKQHLSPSDQIKYFYNHPQCNNVIKLVVHNCIESYL